MFEISIGSVSLVVTWLIEDVVVLFMPSAGNLAEVFKCRFMRIRYCMTNLNGDAEMGTKTCYSHERIKRS